MSDVLPDPERRPATLLTAKQVAAMLGIHVRSLWRMAQSGDVPPPIRLSERVVRWRITDLEAYLDRLAVDAQRRAGKAASRG